MAQEYKKDMKSVEMMWSKNTKIDEVCMDIAHTFGYPILLLGPTFKDDKVIMVFKPLAPLESRPRDMQ